MPTRVLALCGFTQNAYIYSKQLGAIRKTCKDVEFVFLEPPIIVEKADMPWNQNMSDFGSSATTEAEEQSPETTPRAWWLSNGDRTEYRRWDETLRYLHQYLISNPPFDGIMGFSQGGCMAAILAALLEKPGFSPDFPAEPRIQPFKFLISVGGFLPAPTSPELSPLFPLPAHLVTLHIMGRGDVVVTPERSQTLVEASPNRRVEVHDGGHFTPSKASWRHFFKRFTVKDEVAYINTIAKGGKNDDVPAISSFGPSAGNPPAQSGVNTPARAASPAPAPAPAAPAGGSGSAVEETEPASGHA